MELYRDLAMAYKWTWEEISQMSPQQQEAAWLCLQGKALEPGTKVFKTGEEYRQWLTTQGVG